MPTKCPWNYQIPWNFERKGEGQTVEWVELGETESCCSWELLLPRVDRRAGPDQLCRAPQVRLVSGHCWLCLLVSSSGNTWNCALGLPYGLELDYNITSSVLSQLMLSMQTVISLRNQEAAAGIFMEGMLHLAQDGHCHTSSTSTVINHGLPLSTFLLYLSWLMWCVLHLPAFNMALTCSGSWNRNKMKLTGNKLWMFHLFAWVHVYSSQISSEVVLSGR